MVQETFLAGLRSRDSFAGACSERTWLVSILKHKLIDNIRRKGRERPVAASDLSDSAWDANFDEQGGWKAKPSRESFDPSTVLEQREFWHVLHRCLSKLPSRWSEAFALREIEGLDSAEICKILHVSTTNLGVLIHRARLRLWQCLEANWFGAKVERA
jgi:RNA polymerase sigma-70 factor (ECF subfamily)